MRWYVLALVAACGSAPLEPVRPWPKDPTVSDMLCFECGGAPCEISCRRGVLGDMDCRVTDCLARSEQ